MTMEERIKHIRDTLILRYDDANLVHEVRGLLSIFNDSVYQQKIRDAINWAEIYVDREKREA